MARFLGRRPPKNAPALRLAPLLTGIVPAHPVAADHFAQVPVWILGGNDRYGDCGPVSAANDRLLITHNIGGTGQVPTQADIFDLYRRSGNPTFDPNDPGGPGDGGVDMQTMCEALSAGGIGGVKALAFAKVDHTNRDELDAAIALFGGLLLGVNLETAQDAQTNKGLWDYQQSGEWGGHAVLTGRYRQASGADRTGVVTWAQVVDMTDAFMTSQLDEAWVVVWPEHLGSRQFVEGVDITALAVAYRELTGRAFPAVAPPAPTPPPVDPADRMLVNALDPWAAEHHVGDNARAARGYLAWKKAKRL